MPRYTINDPESGQTITLEGDSPPTELELEEIFSSVRNPAQNIFRGPTEFESGFPSQIERAGGGVAPEIPSTNLSGFQSFKTEIPQETPPLTQSDIVRNMGGSFGGGTGITPNVTLDESYQALTRPFVKIPDVTPEMARKAAPAMGGAFGGGTTELIPAGQKDFGYGAAASLLNNVKGIVEFGESPLGVATAGLGATGGSTVQKLIQLGFAADIATKIPDAVNAAADATTPEEKGLAYVNLAATVGLPVALVKSSFESPKIKPSETYATQEGIIPESNIIQRAGTDALRTETVSSSGNRPVGSAEGQALPQQQPQAIASPIDTAIAKYAAEGLTAKAYPAEVPILGGTLNVTDPKTGFTVEGIKPTDPVGVVKERLAAKQKADVEAVSDVPVTKEPWQLTFPQWMNKGERQIQLTRAEVGQPLSQPSVRLNVETMEGGKTVSAKPYLLPGYKGPTLAVVEYKPPKGRPQERGYRVYAKDSGVLIEDSNGVSSLNDTLKQAVQRIGNYQTKTGQTAFQMVHRQFIQRSLREGKPVPPEVLKDYPDLKPPSPQVQTLEKPAIRVEGTTEKMRKSAARAVTSPDIPAPVQERIAQAPESRYKVQPQEDVANVVGGMSDIELASVPKESNIHVASQLELSKRLLDQGKLDEGYAVFQNVSKTGTELGQNINQFKALKGVTPFHVVELVNQGLKQAGRDPLTKPQTEAVAVIANKSIEANKQLEAAKNAWVKDPTDANAKIAQQALDNANKADLETRQKINQYTPKSWPRMLKAFVQGNPLTPISQVANVVGNTMGAAMEAGARGAGSFLDLVRTQFIGGDRKLAVAPISGPVAALGRGGKALKQSAEIMAKGSGEVVKGEYRQNLKPLKAWATLFAKNPDVPTVGGKVPFNERARLAIEGTFGIAPEVMLRMLSAADKPSYEAARGRLINEQSKLSKVPENQRAMAQKFPELFFNRETLKRIEGESLEAVFQQKSVGISFLELWIKNHGGDWADLGFTMLVAPYRLTPWNLVGRTLMYNPLVAAARTGYFASRGNIRQAEMNAGRLMVGSLLYGAGYFLYKNGLIGPSLDSRDESKKLRLLAGEVLPPNHVNISGLNRLKNGEDPSYRPGDETWDLTRGGGAAGAILSSVANVGRDFEKKPEGNNDLLVSLLKNSTLEQASFTINQSFLKGVTGILDAVRDRNIEPYMRGVESMFLNVAAPNTLTTLSRATRKYAPDLTGDSAKKNIENLIRERFGTAGLDDYLPLKRGLWGEPIPQTPEGRNALLYHLFDVSKGKHVTNDPVSLELYDLWRTTANNEVVPSIPTRQITLKDKTYPLNPQQYERFVELVGTERRKIMDFLVVNPKYQDLSQEAKIDYIKKAYQRGYDLGKGYFLKETPIESLPEPKKPKAGFKKISS